MADLARLELWMTYVRWFGVLLAAISIATEDGFPDGATRQAAWSVCGLLAFGSVAIWGALARTDTESGLRRLGALAFAFDVLVVLAFTWLFAFETPYVVWGVLLVVPMEGALRYRLKGAFAGAALVSLFFIAESLRLAELRGAPFDLNTYMFVLGLSIVTAAITGSMAEQWHRQKLAFEEQSRRLAETDRLKDRFLAVTSHEIRTPLTAIIGGVDTVLRRGDRLTPEQRQRMLELASGQGHQLARLVDDLLVTSQLQARKVNLQPQWIELDDILDQAIQAAGTKRRSHHLETFIEPLRCELDPYRLAQIVRNLVENAYKYTPDGTTVSVSAGAADGGIKVVVADNGEGIPEAKRDLLFEAFSRIEETAAGREGVGLGLYVVSQLVGRMGGRIDLASSSKGTTFAIWIPCPVAPGGKLEVIQPRPEQASG